MPHDRLIWMVYVALGPVAWLLYGLGMRLGRRRMALLHRPSPPLPAPAPPVTLIVPVRNERDRIEQCLRSALQQDYENLTVLVIDDRSDDGTERIVDQLAAGEPKLKVLHNTALPTAGLTGKCHALKLAVEHVRTPWLLFIDSDVVLQPDALRKSITFAAGRGHEMLSLSLRMECGSFWEHLLMPLAVSSVFGLWSVALSNNDHHRRNAFANGQYILIRRDTYDAVGGHAALRNIVSDDLGLARLVKSAGYRPRIAWGSDLGAVRMFASLPQIIAGWARNFFGASWGRPWRILMGIVFLLFCCYSSYAAAAWGAWQLAHAHLASGAAWLAAAIVHWVLMTAFLALSYAWSGSPRRYALLLPLGGVLLLWIFVRALRLCITGRIEWRGDTYGPGLSSGAA